jgi:hypothetical protein
MLAIILSEVVAIARTLVKLHDFITIDPFNVIIRTATSIKGN